MAEPLFERGARRGLAGRGDVRRQGHGAVDVRTAVRARRLPRRRRTTSCSPTTSPSTTAPASSTSRPPSAPDDLEVCRAYGLPVVNPVLRQRPLRRRGPAGRRPVLQARRHRPGARARAQRAGCSVTWPTSTPTRTAGGATPRCSTTRCPRGTSGPPQVKDALLRENERTTWYPETIKWGTVRRLAAQQRRLVAVPHPLLGDAAADLALRGRAPHLRGVAGRAR